MVKKSASKKKKKKPAPRPKLIVQCEFCKAECSPADFCHGCKVVICDKCDVSCGETPWGPHQPEEHLEEPEHGTW